MPTNEWFQENPKVSAYISKDLHQHLEKWMEERGVKKVSQAVTQILEEYLKLDQSRLKTSTSDAAKLQVLEGKVEDLLQVVTELKQEIRSNKGSPKVDQSRKPDAVTVTVPTLGGGEEALTTGEAYEILKARGLDKSINTFRRWVSGSLETGILPEELIQYGLQADFETRRTANPKDNRVRWLFLR